uniref:Uncharacterized protein n=1 Tax=Anguilla anguilla TaxID=7936 RepID=A0A0E9VN22_ANGAN
MAVWIKFVGLIQCRFFGLDKGCGNRLVEACAFPLPHSQGALHRR